MRIIEPILMLLILTATAYFGFSIIRHEFNQLGPVIKKIVVWTALIVTVLLASLAIVALQVARLGPER